MILNRMDAAAKGSCTMKIRKIKAISELKREYSVASSTNGKTTYLVTITEIPSCSCPDFEKKEGKCFASNIIFLLVHVLGNTHINKHLEKRHLPRQVLPDLFATTILESYKQEMRQSLINRKCVDKSSNAKTFKRRKVLIIKMSKLGSCS